MWMLWMGALLGVIGLGLITAQGCSETGTVGAVGAEETGDESAEEGGTTDESGGETGDETGDTPAPLGALAINEVVADPESGETDWFELIVVGEEPVQLSGFTIVDDNDDHGAASLGEGTLSPGEFLVVQAVSEEDLDPESETLQVPFKLGAGDALFLHQEGALVDTLDWDDGDAPEGTSYGRLPDGTGNAQTLIPTPGAANEAFSGDLPPDSPFITDRVVDVEVELTEEAWAQIMAAPLEEEWHEGNLIFDGERVDTIGFRVKGNSSLMSVAQMGVERFSFKADLNRHVEGQDLLGVQMLVLNNGFKDPSLMREHLAYEVARDMGLPASRTSFVNLTVADRHLGVYTLVEHVDDEFLEARFAEDGGALYKPEPPAGSLNDMGDDITAYGGVGVKSDEETTDHAVFLAMVAALESGSDEELAAVLDIESALTYFAFNTLLVNLDSYNGMGHNYYLYVDNGRVLIFPWDLNEAFGNFPCSCNAEEILTYFVDEPSCSSMDAKPLLKRLMGNAQWVETYHGIVTNAMATVFNSATMNDRIQAAGDLIREDVYADTTKFFGSDQFEESLTDDVQNTLGLERFVAERVANVQAQIAGDQAASGDGNGGCGGGFGGPGGEGGGPGMGSCEDDADCETQCPPFATSCACDAGHCKPACAVDSDCVLDFLECVGGFCEPEEGSGPGDGGGVKCPDGICDEAEQNNPHLCPEDCE